MKADLRDRRTGLTVVDEGTGCRIFRGFRDRWGYGVIGVGRATRFAHRVAWELAKGPIPAGAQVLHQCDTPACVNVDHLFLGDNAANVRDRTNKGRGAIGRRYPQAKLDEGMVREMRKRAREGAAALGRAFGVSTQTAWTVIKGKAWAWVTP